MGKMTTHSTCTRLLGALAASLIVAGCQARAQTQPSGEPPPAPVKISPASRLPMATEILAPGTVVSRQDARIAAEIAGRLTWVADVGARIAAGEVIARIDDRALQLTLQENTATIKRLEANLRYLEQQVRRQEQLVEQHIAARDALDGTIAERDMAEQDLAFAKVVREQTLYRIERSRVTAPFPGHIVERLAQAGEYISVGGEVARLVDTTHVEVRAQAPMSVAPYLRAEMAVRVANDTHEVQSHIRAVIPVGDDAGCVLHWHKDWHKDARVDRSRQIHDRSTHRDCATDSAVSPA